MSDNENPSNEENTNEEHSSPIKFPCEFVIKVIGKSADDFQQRILALMQDTFPSIGQQNIKERPSKDNNYTALTITVYAESKAQLDAVYQALSDSPDVLMAL